MSIIREDEALVFKRPGRDWLYMIGPLNSPAKNLALGLAIFPPGGQPGAHIHQHEEEILYILAGKGLLILNGLAEDIYPGVACHIPPGSEHSIAVTGEEPLRLITVFSPPLDPGKLAD
jgi:mannose-6-phosphate isomerase-like protein (cupin superfamily)